ncbi:flagellar protein FlaG [Methylobacter tundripaludum]|uniref:Flagellar protein FlaG n=1 Tax=Methylobacter tundripaludum TaxID=173365 RepID=A0A2S6H4R2_9GAMM|nr:flagellar protein FlaG [Methylobacter tundripaludum]PPK72479.1 flagellar protein FlaG [Methylobacter tundripaludum]
MDTLTAVSPPPSQGSGSVQAPSKKDGGPVTAAGTATAQVKLPEQKEPENKPENTEEISNAVKDINNFFQAAQRSLGFSIDEASGHMVMQIKDTETNEVIRQIPGEDAIKLAKRLDDLTGILFKAQA